MVDLILRFWNVVTHLDQYLNAWATSMGGWLYVLLFAVIFAETGLVVTPFLPGDSLLFAIGALCAIDGSPMSIWLMIPLLIVAAVLGDAVNYMVGNRVGPKVFYSDKSVLLNKKHLLKTQAFYEKYGGKTIIIARFVPIIRTFAPFVAGIGQMQYRRFFAYNVVGAFAWVLIFVPAGYWFGNLDVVKRQFHIVIFAIIGLSVMPIVIEVFREWRARQRLAAQAGQPPAPEPTPPQ